MRVNIPMLVICGLAGLLTLVSICFVAVFSKQASNAKRAVVKYMSQDEENSSPGNLSVSLSSDFTHSEMVLSRDDGLNAPAGAYKPRGKRKSPAKNKSLSELGAGKKRKPRQKHAHSEMAVIGDDLERGSVAGLRNPGEGGGKASKKGSKKLAKYRTKENKKLEKKAKEQNKKLKKKGTGAPVRNPMLLSQGSSVDSEASQDDLQEGMTNRDLWMAQLAMSKDSANREREDNKHMPTMKGHAFEKKSKVGKAADKGYLKAASAHERAKEREAEGGSRLKLKAATAGQGFFAF